MSEEFWFDLKQEQEIHLFFDASRLALELTQPPINGYQVLRGQGMKLTTHPI
jgi:hypothetical protein